MAVLEENKLGEITPDMEAFRAMLHSVMDNHIDRYRPHYQFGWTGSPDLANSVAMDALSVSIIFWDSILDNFGDNFGGSFSDNLGDHIDRYRPT